jgi:hypothetical protein
MPTKKRHVTEKASTRNGIFEGTYASRAEKHTLKFSAVAETALKFEGINWHMYCDQATTPNFAN